MEGGQCVVLGRTRPELKARMLGEQGGAGDQQELHKSGGHVAGEDPGVPVRVGAWRASPGISGPLWFEAQLTAAVKAEHRRRSGPRQRKVEWRTKLHDLS
jgi:hypothetical protein